MSQKVKIVVALIGFFAALMLPVFIIVWYVVSHDLPGIGPFGEGSIGSSFVWMFIFVLIYVAILAIPITIVKRKRGER